VSTPLVIGAVAYIPNVVTIWEGMRDCFAGGPAEMDFVLFSDLRLAVRGGVRTGNPAPMVTHRWVLDLVERVGALAQGATVSIPLEADDPHPMIETITAWCARTGNELVEVRDTIVTVRRGRLPDPLAELAADQLPGTRLWLYTNFDCNLACDYCCARSAPQAPRRALGIDRIRRLATEALDAGVRELILTGGEPFLLPDIDELVAVCTAALPTTLLTNGMLFRGSRRHRLQRMDRGRLTLQISLDSATPSCMTTIGVTGPGSGRSPASASRTTRDFASASRPP
jgi:hypothetical protein